MTMTVSASSWWNERQSWWGGENVYKKGSSEWSLDIPWWGSFFWTTIELEYTEQLCSSPDHLVQDWAPSGVTQIHWTVQTVPKRLAQGKRRGRGLNARSPKILKLEEEYWGFYRKEIKRWDSNFKTSYRSEFLAQKYKNLVSS